MSKAIDFELLTQLAARISTPKATCDSLSLCDHSYASFSKFVDIIPDNAPGNTGKVLYKLLIELNNLDVVPQEKLRMLNMLRPITLQCAQQLTRSLLTPETAKAFSLSQALLKYLGMGYRSVIAELCSLSKDIIPIPQLTHAIHHALEILGLIQLKTFQFYLELPKNFWKDLHTLYHISKVCHIIDIPNPGHRHGSEPSATIHCEYVRSLLLSCCQPNHMSNSDLTAIYNTLLNWSQQVVLVAGHNPSLFIVDIETNLAPQLASKVDISTHYQMRIFTDRLIANLQQKLVELPNVTSIDGVSTRLIKNFSKSVTSEPSRQSERIDDDDDVELIYGISDIHQALSGTNFDDFLNELESLAPKAESNSKSNKNDFHRNELFENDALQGASDAKGGSSFPVSQENLCLEVHREKTKIQSREYIQASVLNISSRGACLEIKSKISSKISPGEIIISKSAREKTWKLGFIRWKRITDKLSNIIGVEYLSADPRPRAARIFKPGKHSPYFPVLLLPSSTIKDSAQLVTPIMPFKSGNQIHLIGGVKAIRGQLDQLLDNTSLARCFELS